MKMNLEIAVVLIMLYIGAVVIALPEAKEIYQEIRVDAK